MQINIKDSTASALTNLAKMKNVGVETLIENLIMEAVRMNTPSRIRDTGFALIQDGRGSVNNWQPRFDDSDSQKELDAARARADVTRDMAIAKHRRDVTATTDAGDVAYQKYVERLKNPSKR